MCPTKDKVSISPTITVLAPTINALHDDRSIAQEKALLALTSPTMTTGTPTPTRRILRSNFLAILALLGACAPTSLAFTSVRQPFEQHHVIHQGRTRQNRLRSLVSLQSSSGNEKEGDSLRDKASRLRQEALELEQQLRQQQAEQQDDNKDSSATKPPPIYTQAGDSYWTFSYLFAAKPPPRNNQNKDADDTPPPARFGGKLTVWFRPDGFTDLIQHEPTSSTELEIVKVWGWDVETSSEDEKDYLLFSLDAKLPSGDKVRYYWQARQDTTNDAIGFQDGSVTVKQDVVESGSRWGLFAPQGILAEFRLVGDFVARPAPAAET